MNILGMGVASLPPKAVNLLCQFVGRFFFLFFRRRRSIVVSNFHCAFPGKNHRLCKELAVKSSIRMVELGLLGLALPFFSENRLRKSFKLDRSIRDFLKKYKENPVPTIILLPHFSQMEALTTLPLLDENAKAMEIGVIYRAFGNQSIERWIKKTREKFGLKLLARGKGLWKAKEIMNRHGIIAMLFDQNARRAGVLSNFMGRPASTTDLPNILHNKFHCPVYTLFPQRTGTFSAIFSIEPLILNFHEKKGKNITNIDLKASLNEDEGKAIDKNIQNLAGENITTAMNRWLEKKLRQDEDTCCDWLWVHNRWDI